MLTEKYVSADLNAIKAYERSEGEAKKALQAYQNCLARGMSKEDAVAISGIDTANIPEEDDEEVMEVEKKLSKKAINKKEWEVDYMTMLMKLKEENESGQILGYIKALADCNFSKKEIAKKLKAEFQLSPEEIEEKFKEYEAILQPA